MSVEWRERDQQKCVPMPIKYLYFLAWVVSDVRRKQQEYIHTRNNSVLSGVFSQHYGTVSDVSVGWPERERVKIQENISEAWNVLARLFDEQKREGGMCMDVWMYKHIPAAVATPNKWVSKTSTLYSMSFGRRTCSENSRTFQQGLVLFQTCYKHVHFQIWLFGLAFFFGGE